MVGYYQGERLFPELNAPEEKKVEKVTRKAVKRKPATLKGGK
jgi:hypothetical protein